MIFFFLFSLVVSQTALVLNRHLSKVSDHTPISVVSSALKDFFLLSAFPSWRDQENILFRIISLSEAAPLHIRVKNIVFNNKLKKKKIRADVFLGRCR